MASRPTLDHIRAAAREMLVMAARDAVLRQMTGHSSSRMPANTSASSRFT